MKNKYYLLSVAAATLLCASCTKPQTTLSDKEQTFNPPIMDGVRGMYSGLTSAKILLNIKPTLW